MTLPHLWALGTLAAAGCSDQTPVNDTVPREPQPAKILQCARGSSQEWPLDTPPPVSASVVPDGSGPAVFALSKLYLGDTTYDDVVDRANAWKCFGYDLDGMVSTTTSAGACRPLHGASRRLFADGLNGIDNGFGRGVLPTLLGLQAALASANDEALAKGHFTVLFDLEDLGKGPSYFPLGARAYRGASLGAAPRFDGTDAWPIDSGSLTTPDDVTSAKVTFAYSHTTDDVWVAYGQGDLDIPLEVWGIPFALTVHDPIVSMRLAEDHQSATLGVIAGTLSTSDLMTTLRRVAGVLAPEDLCSGDVIDGIIEQLEEASDILLDHSQDPTRPCDAISIGLGFEARRVELGPIVTSQPLPDPCAQN